jgi:hypothetical protein
MTETLILFGIIYIAIGAWFVKMTASRGLFADTVFCLFWLYYVIRDQKDWMS